MNRNRVIFGVGVFVAAASGFAGGYVLSEKRLRDHYDELSAKEISEARVFYAKHHKADDFDTPEKAAETLSKAPKDSPSVLLDKQIMKQYESQVSRYHDIPPNEPEVVEEDDDVDDCAGDTLENPFVYEEEIKNRRPDTPYIITLDEFMEGEFDHEQSTVTYYEEDDILVDSKDEPVPNYSRLVGPDAVNRFGHGSDQEHTVYVRNEKLELDFEILRNTGSYAKEVLGFEHSDRRPRIRKFKGDDE